MTNKTHLLLNASDTFKKEENPRTLAEQYMAVGKLQVGYTDVLYYVCKKLHTLKSSKMKKKKKRKLTANNKFHILPRKALLRTTFYNGTDFCTKTYSKHGKQCILEVKKEWPLCMGIFISLNIFFFEIREKTAFVLFYNPLFLILIFIQGSFQMDSTYLYLFSTYSPIFYENSDIMVVCIPYEVLATCICLLFSSN